MGRQGQGPGRAGVFVDDRADDAQAEALAAIIGGRAGGFMGKVNALFADGRTVLGIERARISFEIAPDQSRWGVNIPRRMTGGLGGPLDHFRLIAEYRLRTRTRRAPV